MDQQVTRRTFLETGSKVAAGAAAAGLVGGGCASIGPKTVAVASQRKIGPNDKINVALVGCGGMGRYKFNNFMDTKQCNVLAVCDIDDSHMALASEDVKKKLNTTPLMVKDYRKVMDMKDVDVVIIGTPDHWHAIPMITACAAGKDVYCEKPCCHNIREGRAMVDAAKKFGRIVQVGTHQRSMPHIQAAREFVQSGKLGTISMTNTFTYGNESPDGLGHAPDSAPPPGVDYDTWLGPAPVRPYNRRRFHSSWRWYFDYASGMVGDWNVHLQDIVMWSMGVTAPLSVATSGGKFVLTDDRDTPDVMQAVYEFGPAANAPKGFVHRYPRRKASGEPWSRGGYGMEFHGSNGYRHTTRGDWKLEADRKNWDDPKSEFRVEGFSKKADGADQAAHADHVLNYLACVRLRKTPIASIELHYNTVAACHLANVSLRVGRKIFWDAEKELCFTDRKLTRPDREANALLTREYRKGYELPKV